MVPVAARVAPPGPKAAPDRFDRVRANVSSISSLLSPRTVTSILPPVWPAWMVSVAEAAV